MPVAFSLDEAQDLDASTGAIDGAGLWMPTVVGLAGFDDAGHVGAARVSASTLALLDARPLLGRILGPDDDAGASGAALLGETAWRRWFGANPAVVGRSIVVQTVLGRRSSQTVVIVGILPSAFAFPTADTALWLSLPPAGPQPYRAPLLARLSPGADSGGHARRAWAGGARRARPRSRRPVQLTREQDQLVGPVRPALLALTAAVAVLLLIAALNVTNLLLARALARSREFSLRAALGASRGRLIRQGLTESVALGVAGGLAGLAVAAASVSTFRRLAAPLARIDLGTTGVGWGATTFPRLSEAGLDGGIVAAALGLAMAVGLGVGLGAAWRAGHAGAGQTLRVTGATAAAGGRTGRVLRRGLVVAQVAGALPLLVGAVMLARSLQHLADTDPGFSTANVLTFQVSLPVAAYPDARLQVFAEALVDDIRQRPGVRHAGYANQVPMVALRDTAGGLWTTPDAERAFAPDAADARLVSRDYLAAIGVRVVAGRGFDVRDGAGQPRVLLVNEALARRQFPGRDPVGLTVYVGRDITPWAIVGVVADVRQFGLDRAPEPQFFADLRQWQSGMPIFPTGAYFVVATDGRPEALVPDIHALVRELDGAAALFNTARLDAIVASTLTRPRLVRSGAGRLRRDRRAAGGHRPLRRPRLPGARTDTRDRRAAGVGRLAWRGDAPGAAPGAESRGTRPRCRPGGRAGPGARALQPALRRAAWRGHDDGRRRDDLHGRGGRGHPGPGVAGDPHRSARCHPQRVSRQAPGSSTTSAGVS